MKKSDWILATAVLLAAGVLGAWFLLGKSEGSQVVVTIDGEAFGTYPLEKDQVIEIGDGNRLEIHDGTADMIWADCPDQICVNAAPISQDEELIVCMPHKVMVLVKAE